MRYGYPEMHYGGFMIIPAILFTVILVIVIYLLIRMLKQGRLHGHSFTAANLAGNSEVTDSTSKALEILNIRYANGEVTDEEYTTKKEHILKQII